MKIAVCVKEVPGANVARRHDESTGRLVRDGDQILNSYDAHAIEAALTLKESGDHGAVQVVAVCMGPASAASTLRKALALGADEAVLLSDEALVGSDLLATARALAATLATQGPFDLVLMGQQAGDADCWLLPGMVAELLRLPVATQAATLEVAGSDVTVSRQTEIGYERLSVTTPAVISVSDAINKPRYPALKAIMGAKRKPLATVGLADVGLDAGAVGTSGSGTVVLGFAPPPAREGGRRVDDDGAGSGADAIMSFLGERNLV